MHTYIIISIIRNTTYQEEEVVDDITCKFIDLINITYIFVVVVVVEISDLIVDKELILFVYLFNQQV